MQHVPAYCMLSARSAQTVFLNNGVRWLWNIKRSQKEFTILHPAVVKRPLTLAANPSGHSRYCSKKKSICKTVGKAYYLTHEGFIFQSWDRYVMLSRCKVQGETLMCTCSGPHYKPTTYLVLQSVGNSNYRRHFGVQYPQCTAALAAIFHLYTLAAAWLSLTPLPMSTKSEYYNPGKCRIYCRAFVLTALGC